MRIQHNIMAMNAYRNYNTNVNAMKSNLEKLSSGYKINRAGDDAAGLAISEKMRAQITGLNAAQKNVKDGISLVQTAEGAMQEVQDMLNRMVYLATQSANGTYDDEVDRANLQKELDQLRGEIDRISDSANFNGIKLLDGSRDGAEVSSLGAASTVSVTAVADGAQGGTEAQAGVYSFDIKDLKLYGGTATVTLADLKIGTTSLLGTTKTVSVGADGYGTAEDVAKLITVTAIKMGGITYTVSVSGTKVTLTGAKAPTTKTEIPSATALKVDLTLTNTTSNNSYDLSVHAEKPAQVASQDKVAQGKFTLTTAHVKDGAQLTIGKDTYTFKVGKDSTTTGKNVIDLSAYEDGDANLVKAAVEKLSQQSNEMFDITTTTGTTDNITLTEKVGKVDYKKDWDLKGGTGTADGKWNQDISGDTKNGVVKFAAVSKTTGAGKALTFQIGDTAESYNQLEVNIGDIHTKALKIDGISIATQDGAATAIQSIKDAINRVSSIRGDLGATQNRLEHTANNLSVMQENIQDAESSIRDTDVAEEMMAYTKNNILIQSAQAMLAQANQVPQGVLQLLQ